MKQRRKFTSKKFLNMIKDISHKQIPRNADKALIQVLRHADKTLIQVLRHADKH
jgi:hypothetical protein